MSAEEDLELRDLVTQTLENNGVLSKIRAELRANVFLALEEQDLLESENSYANKSFKNFVKTSEGILLTQLVREFLEFFQLDFTLTVFDPETSFGKDYEYLGRNMLLKDLGMKNMHGESGPLLAQILKVACKENESNKEAYRLRKDDVDNPVNSVCLSQDKVIHRNGNNNQPLNNLDGTHKVTVQHLPKADESPDESYLLTSSVKEHKIVDVHSEKKDTSLDVVNNDQEKKKNISLAATIHLSEISPNNDNLTSLSNLPPLSSSIKSKGNVADNNYEEDFQSSASGSGVEGRSAKNSLPESESEEIEEEIGSGIDDLLSNASGLEDLTVDATISNISGVGDYMETV